MYALQPGDGDSRATHLENMLRGGCTAGLSRLCTFRPLSRRLSILATVVSAILLSLIILSGSAASLQARTPARNTPRLTTASPDRVEVLFEAPVPARRQVLINGDTFDQPELPGFSATGQPGTPALPVQRRLVAVPHGASVHLDVRTDRPLPLAAPIRPLPAPYVEPLWPEDDLAGLPADTTLRYAPNPDVYSRNAWMPAQVLRIADRGTWRGVDFVVLEFAPIQVNPAQRTARFFPRAMATLTFGSTRVTAAPAENHTDERLEPLFDSLFINPDQARAWQHRHAPDRRPALQTTTTAGTRWRIVVPTEGLQRLTRDDLATAGLPVNTVDPRRLHLTRRGEPVAMWIDGEADGNFDSDDALYFYAPTPGSRWADYDVYWLTVEETDGLRMATRDATPADEPAVTTAPGNYTLNPQHLYLPYDLQSDEKWFGATIVPPARPSTTMEFPRPADFLAASDPVTITISLAPHPSVTVNRTVNVALNNQPIAQNVEWPAGPPAFFYLSTTVPATAIEVNNTLAVTTTAISYFDAIELEYRRVLTATDGAITFGHSAAGRRRFEVAGLTDTKVLAFDISAPQQPIRLIGGVGVGDTFSFASEGTSDTVYFVTEATASQRPEIAAVSASALRDTSHAVDYLVVSHPAFIPALQPLIDRRAAQGLRPMVVDVTEVYDDFGDGTPDPEAIRNFASYAYHNWAVRPTYLLLVGDGTYDPLDFMGTGVKNWLPPYLDDYDPEIGETASDNAFATVDGSDSVPDILVGRLAVNSVAEATTIVNKTLAYESLPAGDWQRRFLLTTDDAPDSAGDFYSLSDDVVTDLFPANAEVVRAYMQKKANTSEQNVEALRIRDVIADTLNTPGAAIIQYIGHAGRREWAFPAIWTMRSRNDIELLHNTVFPVSLSWTCWESYFIDPVEQSLAESMVRADGKGAVAVFGPTGLDVATGHDWLARGWYSALFDAGTTSLGELALAAKVNLYENAPTYSRLLDTFMLHGDPALQLRIDPGLLPHHPVYLPLVSR